MLVLNRKIGERISIGANITVVVQRIAGRRVTLGIEAPADVSILRSELNPFGNHGSSRCESSPTSARIAKEFSIAPATPAGV